MRAVERRRGMGGNEKEPFVIPYITDGLIFYLDGIEKGDTSGVWTDLINGVVFSVKKAGVVFNSDNVQIGSSSNICLYNTQSYVYTSSLTGTIEACYRDVPTTGDRTVFYAQGNSTTSICFEFTGGNRVIFSAGNSGARPYNAAWTAEATGTYSVSAARAFQNGVSKGFDTNKNYMSRNAAAAIVGGSGRNASTYYDTLNGKIHAIRIYNRQLTEEEILFNQRIDNTRFNLGLTIPT